MTRRGLRLMLTACGVVLIMAVVASAPAQAQGQPPEEVVVTAADDGGEVELTEGQTLVVSLAANPSTGYGWQIVESRAAEILRQTDDGEFQPDSDLLGAPATQIMRFQPVHEGETTLRLEYRRRWQPAAKPAEEFTVIVRAVGTFPGTEAPSTQPSVEQGLPSADEVASEDLPSAFNWCDLGGCTPIKDQGLCGSCWAFATVGPLELNIIIQEGEPEDLSEQYLVSCNSEGWGCAGGSWAHDYHMPGSFPRARMAQGRWRRTAFPTRRATVRVSRHTRICTRSTPGSMFGGQRACLPLLT